MEAPQFYKDFAVLFYGSNRPGAKVSQGLLDQIWLLSMQADVQNVYECIKAFSETDFTEDLKKFDVPTLLLHGEDDQIVPVGDSARKAARLIQNVEAIYFLATTTTRLAINLAQSTTENQTTRP